MTLAEMRREKGMVQRQVAEKMGVSMERITQIENGFPNLTFTVVQRYLQALGAEMMAVHADGSHTAMRGRDGEYFRDRGDRGDRSALRELHKKAAG